MAIFPAAAPGRSSSPSPQHGQPVHALVLSFPMQGHITPLTQLSRRLTRKGFFITFVITEHTSARSPRSPAGRAAAAAHLFPTTTAEHLEEELSASIRMVSVPDGLPPHHPRDRGFPDQEQAMYGMRAPVEHLLRSLQSHPSSAVNCIISDIFVTWSFDIAAGFKLPLVAFYTANATSGSVLYHTRMLISKGIIPFKGDPSENSVNCIPGVLPLRPHEFPPSMQSPDISMPRFQLTLRMFENIHECVGLLLNTVYDMEAKTIDALREKLPVFPIGPLLLPTSDDEPLPTESELTFWEEDECVAWLDTQPPASVLYVSFGSIATYSDAQLRELALGLEASQQPFLWVVRRDAIHGRSLSKTLPEGFLERTKDRGVIVSWAPQLRVLAHAAVGGFLSHCGWNSVLESISIGGVPMLCWPDIADQMVNRRLLVDEWKMGLEFRQGDDGMVGREEVESVVRQLLQSEEGRERRKRAGELRILVRNVVKEGGTSSSNLDDFLRIIREIK